MEKKKRSRKLAVGKQCTVPNRLASRGIPALMLSTSDGNHYFFHRDHLLQTTEFAKTIGATIANVKIARNDSHNILDDKLLVKAMNNPKYRSTTNYVVISQIFPSVGNCQARIVEVPPPHLEKPRSIADIRTRGELIRSFIIDQFQQGNQVSIDQLQEEFDNDDITRAALSNHLSRVRSSLEAQGRQFNRLGPGQYCLLPIPSSRRPQQDLGMRNHFIGTAYQGTSAPYYFSRSQVNCFEYDDTRLLAAIDATINAENLNRENLNNLNTE